MGVTVRLNNLVSAFTTEQMNYREKCMKKIGYHLNIVDPDHPLNESELEKAIEEGNLFNIHENLLCNKEKQRLFDDVKNRHEDIMKLENSIRELHEVFLDLNMLVESQNEMLNHIETNVLSTVDYANRARDAVIQASKSKRSGIKKKICILILLIFAIFLLLFIGKLVICFTLPFVPYVCR